VLKNHETKSEKTFPDDFAHSPMFFTILLNGSLKFFRNIPGLYGRREFKINCLGGLL
jgi:hypothetical protein